LTHACPLQESRAASELEQLRDSKRTADAKIEQLSTELNSAQALAQAQRSVATELRKLLDSEKQSSQQTQQKCCDDVDNLQSTVEELEDELTMIADERDSLAQRAADTSEKEAAHAMHGRTRRQLAQAKQEIKRLRSEGLAKDTKIAQLRTQAATATRISSPDDRETDRLRSTTPSSRVSASPRPHGSNKNQVESAHVKRMQRARRNALDKDLFEKGEPTVSPKPPRIVVCNAI